MEFDPSNICNLTIQSWSGADSPALNSKTNGGIPVVQSIGPMMLIALNGGEDVAYVACVQTDDEHPKGQRIVSTGRASKLVAFAASLVAGDEHLAQVFKQCVELTREGKPLKTEVAAE